MTDDTQDFDKEIRKELKAFKDGSISETRALNLIKKKFEQVDGDSSSTLNSDESVGVGGGEPLSSPTDEDLADSYHYIDVMRPCVENTTYHIRDNGFIDEEASFVDYYLDDEEHRKIRCPPCGKTFEDLEDAFKHLREVSG